MVRLAILSLFILSQSALLAFGAVAMEHSPSPTVSVTQPLHFISSTDDDVIVPPGHYQVEAADAWLKLIPTQAERNAAVLIQATSGNHQEHIDSPRVVFKQTKVNPDLHYLVLVLPGGTQLGAIGSTSELSH